MCGSTFKGNTTPTSKRNAAATFVVIIYYFFLRKLCCDGVFLFSNGIIVRLITMNQLLYLFLRNETSQPNGNFTNEVCPLRQLYSPPIVFAFYPHRPCCIN